MILTTGAVGTVGLVNNDFARLIADKIPESKAVIEEVNPQAVLTKPVLPGEAIGANDDDLKKTSVYIDKKEILDCEPIKLPKVLDKDTNQPREIKNDELAFVDKDAFMKAVKAAGGKNITALSTEGIQKSQEKYKNDSKAIITFVIAKDAKTGNAQNPQDTSAINTLGIRANQLKKYNNLVEKGADCKPESSNPPVIPKIPGEPLYPPLTPITPGTYTPPSPLTPNIKIDIPPSYNFNLPPNTNINPPNLNSSIPNFGFGISGGLPLFNLGRRDKSNENTEPKETIIRENFYVQPEKPREEINPECRTIYVPKGAHTEDGLVKPDECIKYVFEDPNKAESLNRQNQIHHNGNPNIKYEYGNINQRK